MLFRLEEVFKSYGAQEVLRGVSFQINPGDHAGIVGANGAGKTTVFRIISKLEEADSGQVIMARGLRSGVLAQQPSFEGGLSVREQALSVFKHLHDLEAEMSRLEHLMAEASGAELEQAMHDYSDARHTYELDGGFTYVARAETVLAGLSFNTADFDVPADHLSGGQKARLALAKLLLREPDLLLLDEPTNHLDLNAIAWLEEFLSSYKAAFVIISHDRFLLDRIATKIIEISRGRASVYPGNYTAYVKQRDEQNLAQARVYEKQQELISRTEEFIRRNLAGQKTKQAKSRRNMLERMERVEAVDEDNIANFRVSDLDGKKRRRSAIITHASGSTVLDVRDLVIGYPGKMLASGISFMLQPRERLGVTGPNGSGKTTLLKALIGQIQPLSGSINWVANLRLGYYDQELLSLDANSTPVETLVGVKRNGAGPLTPPPPEGELRNFLARFLFTGDDVFKPISALSGGEKSRLALARLIYSQPNVLVLDEPTNHLDIRSREALEMALGEYEGTIITISHDRYFLDKIATQILHVENGGAIRHVGNYLDFDEARKRAAKEPEPVQSPAPTQDKARPAKPKSAGKPGKASRTLSDVELEIAALEQEQSSLADRLSNPDSSWDVGHIAELGSRHTEIASKLEKLYTEWENVSSA